MGVRMEYDNAARTRLAAQVERVLTIADVALDRLWKAARDGETSTITLARLASRLAESVDKLNDLANSV